MLEVAGLLGGAYGGLSLFVLYAAKKGLPPTGASALGYWGAGAVGGGVGLLLPVLGLALLGAGVLGLVLEGRGERGKTPGA